MRNVLFLSLILLGPAVLATDIQAQDPTIRFDNLITPVYGPHVDIENKTIREVCDTWKYYIRTGPNAPDNPWWSAEERGKRTIYDLGMVLLWDEMIQAHWDWKPMVLFVLPHGEGYEITTAYIHEGPTEAMLGMISPDSLQQFLELDSLPPEMKVKAVQKVYAFKEGDGWKLRGAFQQNAIEFKRSIVHEFEFIYHPRLEIKTKQELNFTHFADLVRRTYDLHSTSVIKAYIAPTRSTLNELLGVYHFEDPHPAFAVQQNSEIFIAHGSIWDEHELAHILFRDYGPTSHRILIEGIATYVAGVMTRPTYTDMIASAREKLRNRKAKKLMTLDEVLYMNYHGSELSTVFYATGAWLCARVVDQRGINGLKTLMSDSRTTPKMKELLEFLLVEPWEITQEKWTSEFY